MNSSLSALPSNADRRICVAAIGKPFHLEGLFHLQPPPGKIPDVHLWGVDPSWKKLVWNFENAAADAHPITCAITKAENTGKQHLGTSAFRSNKDVTAASRGLIFADSSSIWESQLPHVKLTAYEGLALKHHDAVFENTLSSLWIQRAGMFLLGLENKETGETIDLPMDWPGWGDFFQNSLTAELPPEHIEVNIGETEIWEMIRV